MAAYRRLRVASWTDCSKEGGEESGGVTVVRNCLAASSGSYLLYKQSNLTNENLSSLLIFYERLGKKLV